MLSSFRYMSQAKHAEARELMYNGALLFFSYNQVHTCYTRFLFCWHVLVLCVQCTHCGNASNWEIIVMFHALQALMRKKLMILLLVKLHIISVSRVVTPMCIVHMRMLYLVYNPNLRNHTYTHRSQLNTSLPEFKINELGFFFQPPTSLC